MDCSPRFQQAAKGQIVLTGGFVYATGTTPAY